jgi:glyoxylase-like metal-dependent hydrolase (beta-lactamase superfamily II)
LPPHERTIVLVVGFPTGSFAANCYLVAPAAGERCVIVDPGEDAVGAVEAALAEHRLRPAAVLLTHGHLDHMASVLPVCESRDVPAYVHPADRPQLSDPLGWLPREWRLALDVADITFREPDDVRELVDGSVVDVAGLSFRVEHAPGHTAGSVVFRTADGGPSGEPMMFAGDLVFAGSIGRTDLPGGDDGAMRASLARVVLGSADETIVAPGHGPSTTIGRERASNPYLQGLSAEAAK